MKSVMQYEFGKTPGASVPRSSFDRSFGHKTTFNGGYLVPFMVDFALPGDVAKVDASFFMRMNGPLDYPILDNIRCTVHFFSCATRLLWTNWAKMHGEQDNPGDSIDFTVPTYTSTSAVAVDSLYDHFGIPASPITHALVGTTALPARMYNFVWNEWYKAQLLDNDVTVDTDDGPDDPADYVLLRRRKRADYFTRALPAPQRGDAIDLPMYTSLSVEGDGTAPTFETSGGSNLGNLDITAGTDVQTAISGTSVLYWRAPHLQIDSSSTVNPTINELDRKSVV